MKSFYIILTSVFFICLFAGISIYFALSPRESEYNTKPTYEYYYNNETETGGDTLKKTLVNNLSTSSKIHNDILNPKRIPETNHKSIAVLINRDYPLPSNYVPSDLVVPDIAFNISYYNEKKLMRKEAATALEKLFQAAKKDNIELNAVSGYRSYARQEEIYNENLRTKGNTHTNLYSAKPGYSEHQSGLSMDVSAPSIDNQLNESLAPTKEGKWLADNCHLFGFTIRYPKGKEEITFYSYEPWHLRYVGLELAGYLFENHLTLEEFYNYVPSEEVKNAFASKPDNIVDIDPVAEKAADPTQAPKRQEESSDSNYEDDEDDKEPEEKQEEPEATPQKAQSTKKPSPTPSPTMSESPSETDSPSPTPPSDNMKEESFSKENPLPEKTPPKEEEPVKTSPPKEEEPAKTSPPKEEKPAKTSPPKEEPVKTPPEETVPSNPPAQEAAPEPEPELASVPEQKSISEETVSPEASGSAYPSP